MLISNKPKKTKQTAYRERMYEAGYKQMQIWVPRESESKTAKMERKMFLRRLESLTPGWSRAKLSRLFKDVLRYVTEKIKEEDL